jgi:hypothetical protein
MVHMLRSPADKMQARWARVARWVWVMLLALGCAATAAAQDSGVHYLHHGNMPPGAIGSAQLQRGGPLPGYFQPVEITAPPGVMISLAEGGAFAPAQPAPVKAGMLIGQVYRIRVTNIALHEGQEVFPTIEVIDRLYAPRGQEGRFPIVIDLNQEDLLLALDNKFVTRVIYLEDPQSALPIKQRGQEWFEAPAGRDPLALADALGRPVAILRLGARLPDQNTGPDMGFFFGCPPFVKYLPAPAPAVAPRAIPPQASLQRPAGVSERR